ncbi:MAG: hypothetical protein ABUL58_00860, partial [Steroidobacter sp.]
LSSGRGDLELTVEMMTELFARSQTPKPLAFVNTVSNAACFYVAQLLGLHSRSNYVCNRYFAFESVLQLAATDISLGHVSSALVGSLDVATHPLNEHRQRLQLSPGTVMGEGSHWLWLGKQDASKPRLGELLDARHFDNRDALFAWCRSNEFNKPALSRGQFVSDADWNEMTSRMPHLELFNYREQRAYYDSHSGAAIGEFLRGNSPAATLLHLNSDGGGRFSVMVVGR